MSLMQSFFIPKNEIIFHEYRKPPFHIDTISCVRFGPRPLSENPAARDDAGRGEPNMHP